MSDTAIFSSAEFKDSVQDLRDLLSQNRLAFILGAGCSSKAGLPLMPELTRRSLSERLIEWKNEGYSYFNPRIYFQVQQTLRSKTI